MRVYRIQRNAFAQRSYAYEERAVRRFARYRQRWVRCLFWIYPFNWISRFGTLRSAIVPDSWPKLFSLSLSLSKYGPRIVSTAQPGTKYPYLPPAMSNREESTLSKLDPLCSKISRFTYSRNDLSPLLRTALVIASGAPLTFRRTQSCALMHFVLFY